MPAAKVPENRKVTGDADPMSATEANQQGVSWDEVLGKVLPT